MKKDLVREMADAEKRFGRGRINDQGNLADEVIIGVIGTGDFSSPFRKGSSQKLPLLKELQEDLLK